MDASSSGRVFEAPPSLAALQSWVHRPQALALCFVSDVYALRALREETNLVTRTTRDVFLLDHFPCKFVQLVGWVAGVDHKDTSMTITLDDGDGDCVLNVSVKLAQVELKVEKEKEKKEARTTFRSVRERVARPPPPQPKNYYVRPDIIVGDTVRLSGYVEEWMRKSDTVRQVVVDEESGSGYVRVVDPDEQYAHAENVIRLHREVYSCPFQMPATAPPASVLSSPTKSILSTWDMTSEADEVEDDLSPDLPHPSKLPSKLLNERTFKYYLTDHLVRETRRAMSSATHILLADPTAQVPELAALFPEYAECTVPLRRGRVASSSRASPSPTPPVRARRASPTPKPRRTATPEIFAPSRAENSPSCVTPRPRSTFRSKAEREAAKAQGSGAHVSHIAESAPIARDSRSTFRSKAERERDARASPSPFLVEATPRPLLTDTSFLSTLSTLSTLSFEPFTVTALLAVDRLETLAALVVDTRARREENERRKRVKEGRITQEDERVVAGRRARGLRSSDYKLNDDERQRKMIRLVTWAIRVAACEGEVVQVNGQMHSMRTMASFDSCVSLSGLTQEAGYVPVTPELLGALLIPLAVAARAERRPTFRSKAEREAGVRHQEPGITVQVLLARLRQWGTDGRWERIAEKPVREAAEWAEASGLLRLGV